MYKYTHNYLILTDLLLLFNVVYTEIIVQLGTSHRQIKNKK